jgi:hypothetical protein
MVLMLAAGVASSRFGPDAAPGGHDGASSALRLRLRRRYIRSTRPGRGAGVLLVYHRVNDERPFFPALPAARSPTARPRGALPRPAARRGGGLARRGRGASRAAVTSATGTGRRRFPELQPGASGHALPSTAPPETGAPLWMILRWMVKHATASIDLPASKRRASSGPGLSLDGGRRGRALAACSGSLALPRRQAGPSRLAAPSSLPAPLGVLGWTPYGG